MQVAPLFWGIDFGAKLSGTTVLASLKEGLVNIQQCPVRNNSSIWLSENYKNVLVKPRIIGIDAPLSLPAGYFGEGDLHYRLADRQLKAMSPMFIGGLTARAIEWSRKVGSTCIEVYPSGIADQWLEKGRRRRKADFQLFFKDHFIPKWKSLTGRDFSGPGPTNIHQLDALLALYIALSFDKGEATAYGQEEEGLIWI